MNSCVYIPQVKNKAGQTVNSILYGDIKKIVKDYDMSWSLYSKTLTPEFKERTGNLLETDENGEPTIDSILPQTNLLSQYVDPSEGFAVKSAETKLGRFNNEGQEIVKEDTYANRIEIARKTSAFNRNRSTTGKLAQGKAVASVVHSVDHTGKKGITPKINRSSNAKEVMNKKIIARLNLHDYLTEYLAKYGIGVGVLDSTLERYDSAASAVIDFSEIPEFATGLVTLIKLAKGEEGIKALPEEFSHFIISATAGNPIIDRLIKNIEDNNLAEYILGDEYNKVVEIQKKQNNTLGVAKEAAGKLLAIALQGGDVTEVSKSLIERGTAKAKETFGEMNLQELIDRINEALEDVQTLTDEIFSENIQGTTSISNITDRGLYYNLNTAAEKQKKSIERKKSILKSAIDNELRKFRLAQRTQFQKGKNYDYAALVTRMKTNLETDSDIKGIYDFIETELTFCQEASETLKKMREGTFEGNRRVALRHIRTQWKSCCGIIHEILEDLEEDKNDAILNTYSKDIVEQLNELQRVLMTLENDYSHLTKDEAVSFFRAWCGDTIAEAVKKGRWDWTSTRKFTPDEIFNTHMLNVNDISMTELWLDAARDSKSFIIQAYDNAIKTQKEKARLKTLDEMRDLLAAKKRLEKAGYKNTKFMYEVDADGKLTGNFVTEVDYPKVNAAFKRFSEKMDEKYGKKPSGKNFIKRRQETSAFWQSVYTTKDGVKIYSYEYKSEAYKAIMSNPAQKAFYEAVMNLKKNLDESADLISRGYTQINHAPRILNDLLQRLKNSSNPKDLFKTLTESLRDAVVIRSDDSAYGVMGQASLVDFENREVNLLPLYYLKMKKGESYNDISTDTVSTMVAYASMINDYNAMGDVIDQMEITRDALEDQVKVTKLQNGKRLSQVIRNIAGESESEAVVQQEFSASNLGKRLDLLMKMNVYGKPYKDEGDINIFGKKISKAKAGGIIMGMTAFTGLAFNTLAAFANAAINIVNINTEAFGGRWFNKGNLWRADKFFSKNFAALFGELESRTKTNMISLFNEEFNITQDLDKEVRDIKARRRSWVGKILDGKSLYFMTTLGDNWAYFRTAFSILDNYKVLLDGKEISLLNAYERVYIDPNDHSLGARLQLKEGVTKLDGTAFTEADKQLIKNKMDYVSQEMFGIYNQLDRNTLQRTVLGRMVIMYRKYIKPNWNRRFKLRRNIAAINEFDEGYYTTLTRFLGGLFQDMKKAQFNMASRWNTMEDWEKKNLRKAMTELVQFSIAVVFAFLLFRNPKKEDPWLKRLVAYQSRRLVMEMGAFIPGPTMISEGFQLVKSPMAEINVMENTVNLIGLLNPYNYVEKIQSGRFEGRTRAHRIIMNSPLGGQSKSIYRATHPEEAYDYFKNSIVGF